MARGGAQPRRVPAGAGGWQTVRMEQTFAGGGLSGLREHNRAAVLRALLDRGPLGRTQLARAVGLTQPALSYITAELLAAGLVAEAPRETPARLPGAPRSPGRRAVPLDLAPQGRYAVAVHAGATGLEVGLVGLRATVVSRRSGRLDHARWGARPDLLAAEVARQARALLERAGIPRTALLGAGVGVAGWVDASRGVVRHHAQLGWRDVPLGRLLGDALGLPVAVEDHVRAMALAEAWFGAAREMQTFVLLYVGAVAGCSTVLGRRVHRGHAAAAGSLAGLPPGDAADGAMADSLEATVCEPAVFAEAQRLAPQHPDSVLATWVAAPPGRVPPSSRLADLLGGRQAAGGADEPALGVLRRRAARLAPAIAQAIALLDPEALVVAGPLGWDRYALQLGLLRDALVTFAPRLSGRLPPLLPSAFGSGGALVGPAALVLRELYSPPLADVTGPAAFLSAAIRERTRK
jgi:predicted NBD/HSP70 family sugar kinase